MARPAPSTKTGPRASRRGERGASVGSIIDYLMRWWPLQTGNRVEVGTDLMKGDFVEPLSEGEKQIVDLAAQRKQVGARARLGAAKHWNSCCLVYLARLTSQFLFQCSSDHQRREGIGLFRPLCAPAVYR